MAIIKSFAPFQNLSNFQVFENDEIPNSEYFGITELKETLTGGKNGFLIEGSEHLKETTEVKIEILDVEGNPIYFEPGNGVPEYYEGLSKLISVHIYDDTPIGIGKITILGELKTYINDVGAVVPVSSEWKGVYNVKWERKIQINKNISNESIVRFYKRPNVSITELVKPILSKTIPQVTQTGTLEGISQIPTSGQLLDEWRAGTLYKLKITDDSNWTSSVDDNIVNISSLNYSPTIVEVLNNKEAIVETPYTSSNGKVIDFTTSNYSTTFQNTLGQIIGESALTGSFAQINFTNLKTFVGDVARVKVFRKSRNAVGDFQFVQESKLESTELLRDVTTTTDTELSYGQFDSYNLTNYWETSSNDHVVSIDTDVLFGAVKTDYDIGEGGTQILSTSGSFEISSDVEYTLNFKTLLSGSLTDENKSIRAYFSGSNYEQNFLTVSGSAIYKTRQRVSQNILSNNTVSDVHLKFDITGDDWYISNVSLRNAQDTSFSPDEFTLIQDIPRKTASETFDFRFEFYDINNNFIPVNVLTTKEFDGGNDFPSSDKLLTFESDRNAFRFSSGSIGNPPFQQIQFKTSNSNLTGSVTYASSAFDDSGVYITPTSYTGEYPGRLTTPTNAGAIISIANFSGSDDSITVGSIVYTASLENQEEFETVYRLEDGDNAPQLIVTSNANQFTYEPTTLSPKPSGQSITVRAQRKNLFSLSTPIEVNSGSNTPSLSVPVNDVSTGIDTYTISALQFSSSFASNNFDEVTYSFTGSDQFGIDFSDEITLSKVINFDAVSLVLSNESTSFPAKSTGEVTGGFGSSTGSVQMFIGGTEIAHDDISGGRLKNTFDITTITESNVTASSTSPSDEFYSITGFDSNKDSGSLNLNIEYLAGDNITSQSFQKIVSYTKAKKAVPTVLTKVSPSTQTINFALGVYETPQTMEVIVQEGGDEYTFDSSDLSDGGESNAQKFNISSLLVNSGSISNSDNILTIGSLTSSLNGLTGSAILDYVDSEGTYVTNKTVRFDLSVSKIGVDGANGASGSNARAVSLTSTKYAVVYDGDGVLFPTSQPFTLTGSAQNFSNPQFQFLQNGSDISDGFGSVSELIIPTTTGSLPTAGGANLYEVRVRETGGAWDDFNTLDNIDIFGVQSGSDSFTVFLTNEAHLFSATSESVVTDSDLEAGEFEVRFFRGAEQYNTGSSGKTYSVTASVQTGLVLSQSLETNNQTKFRPTSLSADSGKATIVITDNNTSQTFNKEYTFSKSKEGLVGNQGDGVQFAYLNNNSATTPTTPTAIGTGGWTATPTGVTTSNRYEWVSQRTQVDGTYGSFSTPAQFAKFSVDGDLGADGKRTASNMIHYQITGSSAPTTPSATSYTFATNTFAGLTSNWGTGAPVYEAGNSNKYWFSTYTVVETTAGGGTGAPTFSDAVQAIGFTGLVSFTADDTVGDGSANLSFGVAGATLINGDNISTGRIISTNYATGSGDGFTTTGTEFSLDEGLIASKNFTVKPNGDAIFKGNLEGAGGTFSGNLVIGGTSTALTALNTTSSADIQEGTSADNVGLGNVENKDAQNQAQSGLISGTTITGGGITLSGGGNIKGGQTAYATGTGFFLGYDTSAYKFSIGNTTNYMRWTGTDLVVKGEITATSGTFTGAISGGTISVPATSPLFEVDSAGQMTATNANLSGEVTATSGEIGGWGIATSRLYSPTTGQERMELTGGTSPNITVLDSSGSPNVIINSGTALSDLSAGATTAGGTDITGQTTLNASNYTLNVTSLTLSNHWLAGPTSGLYMSNVPVGSYNMAVTINIPGGNSNALSGLTISTVDAGNSYTFATLTQSAKAVVYISTSGTPYSTKNAMNSGAVWIGYKTFNNTQNNGNFGTEFYLPSNQSSGTTTHQLTSTPIWTNNSQTNYYFHTALMDFTSTVTKSGGGVDINIETDLKTPTLAGSLITVSGTVSRTEISGGGLQVVSTTSNFVKMQRYTSSQAASVVMLDVGGSIEATGNITANASDMRLKNIKGLITNPLSKLKQLNGVVFNWNEIANKLANHDMERDHVGLIAQDVQKVLPEVVTTSAIGKKEGNDYLTIWYDKLIPLLVESIKELSEKVEKLEEKNKELENGN